MVKDVLPQFYFQPVDLRRQDEIRFGQPIHRVRPGRDLDFAPSQQDIGMMALLLGQRSHSDSRKPAPIENRETCSRARGGAR